MSLWNYDPVTINPFDLNSTDCLETIVKEMSGYKVWRSDFIDPMQDYGYELVRRELLVATSDNPWLNLESAQDAGQFR